MTIQIIMCQKQRAEGSKCTNAIGACRTRNKFNEPEGEEAAEHFMRSIIYFATRLGINN